MNIIFDKNKVEGENVYSCKINEDLEDFNHAFCPKCNRKSYDRNKVKNSNCTSYVFVDCSCKCGASWEETFLLLSQRVQKKDFDEWRMKE